MKKGILSSVGFVTMIIAISMTMPTVAQSLILTPIKTEAYESKEESGGDPWAWLDNTFGIGILGPGPGTVNFLTNAVFATVNAASLNTAAWYMVWRVFSTQTSFDSYGWAAVYQLNGGPEQSANINLDYTYTYNHYNAALDGRSKSESSAAICWSIFPSDEVEEGKSVLDYFDIYKIVYFYLPTKESFDYNNEYYFLGLSWGEDTKTGSIPLGSMEVGDYLFVVGLLTVQTEAQLYLVPAATVATAVSSFWSEFVINEIPPTPAVPEPATMLLLGSGLIGLAGYGRKKFFKK